MDFRLNYHLGTGKGSAEPRYKPCQVLFDNHIPHAVWFEDALVHYGVPTVVFDLYILVPDIDLAANLLAKAGWTFDMQRPFRIGNAEVDLVDFLNSDWYRLRVKQELFSFPLQTGNFF